MEKEPIIIGRGLIEKKEELKKIINEERDSALAPFEGELQKNERLLLFIDFINYILKKEFNFLGLEKEWENVDYQQVHLLSSETFEKKFPGRKDTGGACNRFGNYMIITTKKENDFDAFKTLIHELLHLKARKSFGVNEEGEYYTSRQGLSVDKIVDTNRQLFLGPIDEGFVDFLTEYLIDKYKDEIDNKLAFKDMEPYHSNRAFWRACQYPTIFIVEKIINKISNAKKVKKEEIISLFEKNYFAGNLLPVIKEIVNCCGGKSLEVLKKISFDDFSRGYSDEFHLFLNYFDESTDEKKRKEIENKLGIIFEGLDN